MNTDQYNAQTAIDLCIKHGMHKEQAYLLLRVGETENSIKVLIDKCHNVSEVIEFAV
jgi:hypothetical protein